jgi:hypothetical protein
VADYYSELAALYIVCVFSLTEDQIHLQVPNQTSSLAFFINIESISVGSQQSQTLTSINLSAMSFLYLAKLKAATESKSPGILSSYEGTIMTNLIPDN